MSFGVETFLAGGELDVNMSDKSTAGFVPVFIDYDNLPTMQVYEYNYTTGSTGYVYRRYYVFSTNPAPPVFAITDGDANVSVRTSGEIVFGDSTYASFYLYIYLL